MIKSIANSLKKDSSTPKKDPTPDAFVDEQKTIPTLTEDTMAKTITDRLSSIEQSIRHKNDLIQKLKIIQEDVLFILSETDKLTASDEPLTLEGLNDLTVIYGLVEHIFNLMDKTSSDEINQDIGDMMTNLSLIRGKIIGATKSMDKTDNATTGSSGTGSSGTSGTSTAKPASSAPVTSAPATSAAAPATSAAAPATSAAQSTSAAASQISLSISNIESFAGKKFKNKAGTNTVELNEKIINFGKKFLEKYNPEQNKNEYQDFPPELATILTPGYKFGEITVEGNELKLGSTGNIVTLKLRKNIFESNGTTYYIFTKQATTDEYSPKSKMALILYIDNGLKHFFYRGKENNDITLNIPVNDKYIAIGKVDTTSDSNVYIAQDNGINNMKGQFGGKTKKNKKRKNKKKTLRFL